jgi:peptidoglycan/LPS O-acetylase OafA/YrhL
MPIIYLFRSSSHQLLDDVLLSAAGFLAILLVSWVNFHFVEKRGARLIRALGKRWSQLWAPASLSHSDSASPVIPNRLEGF